MIKTIFPVERAMADDYYIIKNEAEFLLGVFQASRMSKQSPDYGVLEQLPQELQYLKHIVWEATLLDEEALHDDNPEYADKVVATMRQAFHDLAPYKQAQEALRHRAMIWSWLQQHPGEQHPDVGGLYFIHGLLTYAEGLFTKQSA